MKERAAAERARRVPGETVPAMARMGLPAAAVMASMGAPAAVHLSYVRRLLERIPDELRDAARHEAGARALILALLLADRQGPIRSRQLEAVAAYGGEEMVPGGGGPRRRRRGGGGGKAGPAGPGPPRPPRFAGGKGGRFRSTAQRLIREDGSVRMFDYALVHILDRHLARAGSRRPDRPAGSLVPPGAP
jgi:hypothetical protein